MGNGKDKDLGEIVFMFGNKEWDNEPDNEAGTSQRSRQTGDERSILYGYIEVCVGVPVF